MKGILGKDLSFVVQGLMKKITLQVKPSKK